ncbi:hypothetical protein BDZ45DRAFT_745728 [Acephala macrosclerotiorum]|nr:hypothetical protein BDZ45DRAFT_745728 [Acephala macrosclerotiorum]
MAKWNTGIDATVLVARQDQKDINPHQVEALSEFCSVVLERTLKTSAGAGSRSERERFVEEYLRPENFDEFFERLKLANRIATGDGSCAGVISPLKFETTAMVE